MAVLPILQLGAPELRRKAVDVVKFDAALGRLLDDMRDTMHSVNGVGLAANQIGRPERACIIEVDGELYELINPEMEHLEGSQTDHEGCLSVAGWFAPLERYNVAVVTARDRTGKKVRVRGEALLARALQHELDHLQGGLYVDRLPSMDLLERPDDEAPARRRRRARLGSAGQPEPDPEPGEG